MKIDSVIRVGDCVEAVWVDDAGGRVRCHWYAACQMDMLRADLGDDAGDYAELIAEVEAGG